MSSLKFKCGYCGWLVWSDEDGKITHSCFANCEEIVMDKDRNLFRNDSLGAHSRVTNESSIACIEEGIEKENIPENFEKQTDRDIDEDLISAVKGRPALYDYRISVKERGRKQKDCLWQEISEYLNGFYTATEAEKRWTCLKDCYRKSRNIFKKKQSVAQKSGAAGIPKNYEIKPSFRYYDLMAFLTDTLEYRETVTSLQKSCKEPQASSSNSNIPCSSNSNSIASTSTTSDNFNNILSPVTNNNTSTSLSPVSPISTKSKKRKKIDLDDYEQALLNSLTQNTEANPIDGFVLRLAEGLRRLSYKSRSKLEIEFLSRLYEVEEENEK
ncbi:uncharacterized protein LOC109610035 [Camponotus floridanus]|nr:uncharacterized protein LOC109610035 [Camponotus floridanus]